MHVEISGSVSYTLHPRTSLETMLTIDKVIALKDVVKWHTVFSEAGLNASTMRSAMHYRRPLRVEEAAALTEALAQRGIVLTQAQQQDLSGGAKQHRETAP